MDEPYADIFAIEACSSLQNLLDKRSRFAPSTQSMLALCPISWLLAPVLPNDPTPRWVATGLLEREPTRPLIVPVRDMRVMFGLRPRHYEHFATSQVPHAHEYFVPMERLTEKDGADDPGLRALVSRASVRSNFFSAEPAVMRSVAVAPQSRPVVVTNDVMVDPFGHEVTSLAKRRLRMMDPI